AQREYAAQAEEAEDHPLGAAGPPRGGAPRGRRRVVGRRAVGAGTVRRRGAGETLRGRRVRPPPRGSASGTGRSRVGRGSFRLLVRSAAGTFRPGAEGDGE